MDYSNLSTEALIKKERFTRTMAFVLAGMLLILLALSVYLSIKDGFSVLLVIPIALSSSVFVNLKNAKAMRAEIDSRNF